MNKRQNTQSGWTAGVTGEIMELSAETGLKGFTALGSTVYVWLGKLENDGAPVTQAEIISKGMPLGVASTLFFDVYNIGVCHITSDEAFSIHKLT